MNTKRYEGFSGTDKAAALLMTLPPEHSASVVRCLSTEQVERVTKKIHTGVIPPRRDAYPPREWRRRLPRKPPLRSDRSAQETLVV